MRSTNKTGVLDSNEVSHDQPATYAKESNMSELDHSRTVVIDAPLEKVWETLADLGNVSNWIPTVKTSTVTSSQTDGLDSTRVCTLSPMGTITEEVAAWEPNKRLLIDIVEFKGMPMMRTSQAEFVLESVSDSETRVTISMGLCRRDGRGRSRNGQDGVTQPDEVRAGRNGRRLKEIRRNRRAHWGKNQRPGRSGVRPRGLEMSA